MYITIWADVVLLLTVNTVETRYNEISYSEFCFITNCFPSPSQAPILKYGTSAAYNKNAYSEFPCIAKGKC